MTQDTAHLAVVDDRQSAQSRACTCHPDDNPPRPCPQKFAYRECVKIAHAELALKIALAAGLNRCPHTPAGDVPVMCGCPHDRCEYLKARAQPMTDGG